MSRYFLEVSYKGTNYSGFQSQKNANTIQAEVEKAFEVLQKNKVVMVSSSRTDAGVHALQNFFHFDHDNELHQHFIYKMNAILPGDIVIKNVSKVSAEAHCRFDALSREYKYFIYSNKDPFLKDRSFYFPFPLDIEKMKEAGEIIKEYSDFTSFSKRNTQVKTFTCQITESIWESGENSFIYQVKANRFLRGMVRALVATMLQVGRNKISIQKFREIIEFKDCTQASFAAPSQGLFLIKIEFPDYIFWKE